MPSFHYKAYDSSGSTVIDVIEANNLLEVKKLLHQEKLRPVEIVEKSNVKSSFKLSFGNKSKVSQDDIEFITAELSLLLDSGVKIDKALAVLASAKSGGALALLLNQLSTDVRKGISLSSAMEQHSSIFDKLYINLVRIGESSGNLSEVFSGLAKDLKYRKELKSKIVQASTYPLIIFIVCILSILFIFNFVVPKLTVMFNDTAELPIYTEILINLSVWIQDYQFILAGFLFSFGMLLKYASQQGYFEGRLDESIIQLPVLGASVELIERIRFTSSMSLMLNSGVKLDSALELSAGSVKNKVIYRNLSIVKDKVRKGDSITRALRQSHLFPDLYLSLLEVGEESGNMAPIFSEISTRSRTEFSNWTDRMTSLIEPLMILFMGGVVGSVVVVMLLSIVSVNDVGF